MSLDLHVFIGIVQEFPTELSTVFVGNCEVLKPLVWVSAMNENESIVFLKVIHGGMGIASGV